MLLRAAGIGEELQPGGVIGLAETDDGKRAGVPISGHQAPSSRGELRDKCRNCWLACVVASLS